MEEITRDQRAADQHDRHRCSKARYGDNVQQPLAVGEVPHDIRVPSPVEHVVDDHERKERGA
jgi:hypothetical protein